MLCLSLFKITRSDSFSSLVSEAPLCWTSWRRLYPCPTSPSRNSDQNPWYTWEYGPGVTSCPFPHQFSETLTPALPFTRCLWIDFLCSSHSSFICSWGVKAPAISLDKVCRVLHTPQPKAIWVQTHCPDDHCLSETGWAFSLPFTKWAGFLFSLEIIEQL